jgi:uncharacterized DUF497 family protein
MSSEFEWDPEKAVGNFGKHGMAFEEAGSVFFDPLSITIDDPNTPLRNLGPSSSATRSCREY